ncbi:hypothetical protein WG66_008744 [Moniliophthora roreri]|nr:hypothetical protein WG66_008744 [Moniliophthora roreri]
MNEGLTFRGLRRQVVRAAFSKEKLLLFGRMIGKTPSAYGLNACQGWVPITTKGSLPNQYRVSNLLLTLLI